MRSIKKVAIVAIALSVSVVAYAQQKGEMAVGGDFAIGIGSDLANFGIGARFQYDVVDQIRMEGSFMFFLPKKEEMFVSKTTITMWEVGFTGHFLLPLADRIILYPLVGLSVVGAKAKFETILGNYSDSKTGIGLNLGGGLDVKISGNLFLNVEPKLKIVSLYIDRGSDTDRNLLSVWLSFGIKYKF